MREDITIRLAIAALDPQSVEPKEMEALLREAIVEIELLRVRASMAVTKLVLDDLEPEGEA
ncbi:MULTISPECIES: hypothetical protein [Kaistia]|uniref:Uncharacterized protein n=1 Tax=Kaistia nematophila TaxID=2994654 RepID=A0A9X3IL80_9HYPH|nr:hypothetical protein [Kaistia nematophila]MCX5569582.1 hypothetical protein [Kaistia nematophila]